MNLVFCQEKLSGAVPEGESCFAKGKVAWLDMETAKNEHPHLAIYFKEKPRTERLEELKIEFQKCLEMKGHVFTSEVLYRYTVSKNGNTKDFGINYKFIR